MNIPHRRISKWALAWAGSALLVSSVLSYGMSGASRIASPHYSLASAGGSWTVYHGNSLGTGVDTSGVSFASPILAWKSPVLNGEVYGEPLESSGRVFIATENDSVYALAANTGAVIWSTQVGNPVPNTSLPCGNISPNVGITGTPVIDEARGEIFAVADESAGGTISHHLVGLNIFTGVVLLDQVVDPPGSTPSAQLQRTGLNLSNGNVVFGFGGNDGDCGSYHGWIVAVPEGGGTQSNYEIDSASGQREGAVWMGGAAPEVDGSGNIWAAAGNGSVTSASGPYDFSDSVFELSPQLALKQFFAPSDWFSQNNADADLGSTAPAIIGNGTVLQVGKSKTGYLLNQSNLGQIGGQLTTATVCASSNADGGDAVVGTDVFVPCGQGVEDVHTTASPSVSVVWTAASGAAGSPIVAGGLVWSIKGGTMFGINPSTGATVQQLSVGGEANHFPTPSVGDGLLLAPSTDQVYAYSGSVGAPPPPPPPPPAPPNSSYWLVASDGGIFTFGNAGFYGSTGATRLNQPVVGMAATPSAGGYWLVASDGGIFAFGNAGFHGSTGAIRLNRPIVGMASTPTGGGYWLVAADGGVFTFGDAHYFGSTGATHLNKPIVGMAATPDGGGYWLVAADGGIFTFGDARFFGSTGATRLNQPIVGMVARDAGGYWLVASDGGIFTFGGAPYLGSTGAIRLNRPIVGMTETRDAGGYWLVASDGGVFTFGDARFNGSEGAVVLNKPVVGMAAAP